MYIESVEVGNYKCFWEPQKIQLESGFNLFVGANNSGKTTVLEALDLTSGLNEPHRSVKNLSEYGARPTGQSRFVTRLATDFEEMRRLVGNQIYLPLPENYLIAAGEGLPVAQEILASGLIKLEIEFNGNAEEVTFETMLGKSSSVSRSRHEAPLKSLLIQCGDADTLTGATLGNFANIGANVGAYHEKYRPFIYRFSAQRRPAGECGISGEARLDREANNLPYCINYLQTNDAHGHKLLCEWVNRIFPSVKWIQAPPKPHGAFQLHCLPVHPEGRRDDLSIPILRMGTGIGNVIAMLYVVLTSRQPQVIAIDEPNSFLHPRALRELLHILTTEGKQHQLILTAHSPDVLTAVKPNLITMFGFDGASTTVQQVDAKNISTLRYELADLGIRMTDLHGRDRVLWVEGQTEELVMPELLRLFCPEIAAGTAVLRVEHTGTFEKKGVDPSEVAKLYHRLTGASALVPPMIAILLDGESRTEAERNQLEQKSNGVLRFLDRIMLENYILFPEAIHDVLNNLGENVSLDNVMLAMKKAGYTEADDVRKVHGAKMLKAVFSDLSGARHEFNKTRDVPEIISWLVENNPDALQPLGKFLRSVAALK
jgi:predicted ATPase